MPICVGVAPAGLVETGEHRVPQHAAPVSAQGDVELGVGEVTHEPQVVVVVPGRVEDFHADEAVAQRRVVVDGRLAPNVARLPSAQPRDYRDARVRRAGTYPH